MNAPSSAHVSAAQLDELRASAQRSPMDPQAHMRLGQALHMAGELTTALAAFEKARALAPQDINAVSACASMLFELSQPQAAYGLLKGIAPVLVQSADGACNLAIAAETCGEIAEAKAAYTQALALDPLHARTHNNLALMAAGENRWPDAVTHATRCVEQVPQVPEYWMNLADMLAGARNFASAVNVLQQAIGHFPQHGPLRMRQVIFLAFDAQFGKAQDAMALLGAAAEPLLRQYLAQAGQGTESNVNRPQGPLPTLHELFTQQAFEAMRQCDWRYNAPLVQLLREMLQDANRSGKARDWRDAQFYALALPMGEDEVGRIRELTGIAINESFPATAPALARHRRSGTDGRQRIGIIVQNLRDPRVANGLARQLALHDASRYAIHLYATTPKPQASLVEPLAAHAESVTEIAHLSVEEAVARIRLNELDLLMETTFYTPWCRPEIPRRIVAPVQICQLSWQRIHPQQSYQYAISDTFVHPDGLDPSRYGAIVRLPQTCWLATNDDQAGEPVSRADLGLPDGALVLCAFLPALAIDPESFALWMQAMRALPDAVLLLPAFSRAAQDNLKAEARAAGVADARLVFTTPSRREEMLARMQTADLFIDTLHFNANHGLVDALRMGVPAVSCAGASMSSRLGGSIIRAAGLPQCVHEERGAYLDAIVKLGQDRDTLAALRAQLAAARSTAPLFDTARRVKEWEAAWSQMIEREQAGRKPEPFDIQSGS